MEQSVNKKRHSSNQTFSFSSDDSIKQRFFAYYCHIIQKKQINILFTCLLILIETIQTISYAFTSPLVRYWTLSSNTTDYIQKIVGAPHVNVLMQYLTFTSYLILWIVLCAISFISFGFFLLVIRINDSSSKLYTLERYRSNKEKYCVGKASEPL